ncbi:MAG TPA: orotidine-5'-phosphate decarboxylase [Burkholderiales bacterium]|nr:orotidine-5'-phosphate decarboxylase [Burkholderiales bacterium]
MNKPVIVALDFPEGAQALKFSEILDPSLCRLKVGKELFTSSGPHLVENLMGKGFEIFLDLKFHDIPNTVASACKAASSLGVWMMNVHALGGSTMMKAARSALEDSSSALIAVTLLTSMGPEDIREIGLSGEPDEVVERLADLAKTSGLDGVVCSAREAALLRKKFGSDFLLVTPGIRPSGSEPGDQRRVMTPREAILNGSDYLVMGRPIREAADPNREIEKILEEIR